MRQEHNPNWKCYHHSMSNLEQLQKCKEALDDLKATCLSDLEKVKRSGKLKLKGSQFKDSIDYVPAHIEEIVAYLEVLGKEMEIRDLPTADKSASQMREIVRSHLLAEKQMVELIDFISQEGSRSEVMSRIMRYVPCIMHVENRCGIKMFEMVLSEGLSNAQGGLIYLNGDNDTITKQQETYISEIEKHMNEKVLGSEGNIAQYRLPVEKATGEPTKIGTVKMENYQMRRVIDNLDDIIDISVTDGNDQQVESRKEKWKACVRHYKELMRILRKKGEDYTPDELIAFEEHSDLFFQLWVELHGRDGVTNSIHMIGCGHMLEYMIRWGNLTKYSQQGWEALNALIKLFFFRRTNKGGGRSAIKSKLLPIGQLMQRRFFWICNLVPDKIWDSDYNINNDEDGENLDYDDYIFDGNENEILELV